MGRKVIHLMEPAAKLETIDSSRYKLNSMTPLYDAMGDSITSLRQALEKQKDYNVLVTILTDGEENTSKEYNGDAIKKLVEEMKQSGWTFTYIGTDHNVESFAINISITNVMAFKKDLSGVRDMFQKKNAARASFSRKIRENKPLDDDFYKDDNDQNTKK